mgnify:CR=1 FL=1
MGRLTQCTGNKQQKMKGPPPQPPPPHREYTVSMTVQSLSRPSGSVCDSGSVRIKSPSLGWLCMYVRVRMYW